MGGLGLLVRAETRRRWLALVLIGLLVGAGLVMEHHELGPVETGRRLVDVVQDRFR